ncbi:MULTISPECIES: VOC family protein [Kitasatospora]|uniref:VOC domain-containing protein n=1 Tax=Kitasatospora setae (strain ATCC 33774 / DSM 43861 / JCM 3304 / KCC A-0304 / NBRC 14216 / KM-6054) TaxID=452652 RepID=E4N5S1_KITSK|nr:MULTISPECIES: VOC family protein [Kitasatospora]BAJ26552.1 hypothetical protein KSE_07120 [Kitasatospora setae KM-6054]
MASRISELVLGCREPEVLARFWCEVLDFVVLDREADGSVEIGPREGFGGAQPTLFLSAEAEPAPGLPRLHIDVNPTDRDQAAELERLLALGARPAEIGQTGEEPWHVLSDPNTPDSQFWSDARCRPPPLPVTRGIRPPPNAV